MGQRGRANGSKGRLDEDGAAQELSPGGAPRLPYEDVIQRLTAAIHLLVESYPLLELDRDAARLVEVVCGLRVLRADLASRLF